MDYMEMCFEAVINNDVEEFERILLNIEQLITVSKAIDTEIKWFQDIPVLCTLYNNHGFIKKIRKRVKGHCNFKSSDSLGHEINAVDLANALNFRKCKEQLIKLYCIKEDVKRDKLHVSGFAVYAAILNVGQIHNIEQKVIIQCFQRLVENGIDIHARGPENRTILLEAVLKSCNPDIFKLLFSLGCDVNDADGLGQSAFFLLICRACDYKCKSLEFIRILTIFLHENVDTSLDTRVVHQALLYDRCRFPDVDDISDDECTADSGGKNRVHPMEHLRLLPRLYKCGFHINQQNRDIIELPSLFRRPVTYNLSLDKPRSLKESARIAVRATYPGRRLHTVISSIPLPKCIRNYILMECLNIDK